MNDVKLTDRELDILCGAIGGKVMEWQESFKKAHPSYWELENLEAARICFAKLLNISKRGWA